jgi:butyryl-CoA dehydrogenase
MIHEGAHGIHGLDLLGRKVLMEGGAALGALAARTADTAARARAVPALADHADALDRAVAAVGAATAEAWSTREPEAALANATPYLQAFGHTVVAWIWLDVAVAASRVEGDLARGKLQAARYFFRYELPRVDAWLAVVSSRDDTCRAMNDAWW